MDDNGELSVFGTSIAPRKEDILFCANTHDWITNACISTYDAEYAYSSGYRNAALVLAERVCETHSKQDTLVYPIVYLYRHHVELVLKNITFLTFALLDRNLTQKDLDTLGKHKLDELWKNLKPLLNPTCELVGDECFPDEHLEGIGSYIQQLHEHDPDGQRFRYATVKRGGKNAKIKEPSLKETLSHINIRVFAIAMEKLADYLEGIEGWFGDLYQQKCEIEKEFY